MIFTLGHYSICFSHYMSPTWWSSHLYWQNDLQFQRNYTLFMSRWILSARKSRKTMPKEWHASTPLSELYRYRKFWHAYKWSFVLLNRTILCSRNCFLYSHTWGEINQKSRIRMFIKPFTNIVKFKTPVTGFRH